MIYINGHFYNKDGTFEGKINEPDYEGSINDVYVCDGKSTQKDKKGNDFVTYNNTKILKDNEVNIYHDEFIILSSTVYGESSFPYIKKDDENLKFEMFSIASVNHAYKETAFGKNSTAAKDFRKKLLKREMIQRCKLQYLLSLIPIWEVRIIVMEHVIGMEKSRHFMPKVMIDLKIRKTMVKVI